MVTIKGADLTLTTTGSNTTINVKYTAIVNALERHMCANGMALRECIGVFGMDPAGSLTGSLIKSFLCEMLPVTAGSGSQSIARNRSITVPRAVLNEDTGLGDNDEIRCKITITPWNLPAIKEGWTDQEILVG